MRHTAITPAGSELAIGNEFQNGEYVAQPYEWHHTTPASSINATASDMARFLLAHLGDGALEGVRVLSEAAARTTFERVRPR